MRHTLLFSTLLALVSMAALSAVAADDEADKPKHSIKEVMTKAHKGDDKSLLKTIVAGKGSAEDKALLLELYQALGENKPPKGDQEDWMKRTDEMIAVATEVVDDKEGSTEKLGKTVNCGGCHELHKPPPPKDK
jgi:hypothetical protein